MKKSTFSEKLQYQFDNLMAKGTVPLVGMLFGATTVVILLVATALSLFDQNHAGFLSNVWASMMHIIDAGTITGADTADVFFVILMSIATLCGLFVTSILIGIITTGFEEKLDSLKKGNSRVIESNHTVILGFDHNVFTIISGLVQANENQKDGCIVILSEEEKETVEHLVSQAVPDLKTTRVICRTGALTDTFMLEKCSLESAKSIIINAPDDFVTVKAILTINNYFENVPEDKQPHIVATIRQQANYDAIQIIDKGNVELLLVEDSVSRIIAQTCRQPGLSNVLIDLFDYDGDELYFESFESFNGKPFGETLNAFEEAVVFGYRRNNEVFVNPPADTLLEKGDDLILLVEDDGMAKPAVHTWADTTNLVSNTTETDRPGNVLIIGNSSMLQSIVMELDEYFPMESKITIAHHAEALDFATIQEELQHIALKFVQCDTSNRLALEALTADRPTHVLLLSADDCDEETADSITLLQLIHLRDIAQITGQDFNITSEMQAVANQKLAQSTQTNDLVVGSNIINLIVTQISETRSLATVFREILSADGSEIYIRKASNYVQLHQEMDFYQITEILKQKQQIAVGYQKLVDGNLETIINPNKAEKHIFTEEDCIISLAAD